MRITPLLLLLLLLGPALPASAETPDSLSLPNATLHYYTSGQGSPVLILSGGPGISSHQEDDLAQALAREHRVILFDQRGTGRSWSRPFDSTTVNLDTAVADIERLRQHLGIKRLTIAGHSWGAMLASFYAATHPGRVENLILICGGEIDPALTPVVDAAIEARFQLADTTEYFYWSDSANYSRDPVRGKQALRRLNWAPMIYDRQKLGAVLEQAAHGEGNPKTKELLWRSFSNSKTDWPARLRRHYRGRALIVYGWQDPVSLTTLQLYREAYPKAKVLGINRCGHMPGVEQPEVFFGAVTGYLRE